MERSSLVFAAIAAVVAVSAVTDTWAQAYPSKPVKIIAPVQPGGGVDLVGRTVAEQLTRSMNSSFVVENLAGRRRRDRLADGGATPPLTATP